MYKKKYIVQFFGTMCKTRKVKKSKLKEFRITFFCVTQKRFLALESHTLGFSQFTNDFFNLGNMSPRIGYKSLLIITCMQYLHNKLFDF